MHTQAAHNLDTYFSGTVAEKMATAQQLAVDYMEQLENNGPIKEALFRLRRDAALLQKHMLSMGMDRLCSCCAAKVGGGCCSAYMADNSDAILLFINALMNVRVTQQQTNNRECCFLGQTGCTLLIKPIFCLNYNCLHIHVAAEQCRINTLERLAGILLQEQIQLETELLAWITGQLPQPTR